MLRERAFRRWLAQFRPDDPVGFPFDEKDCPIARWISVGNDDDKHVEVHTLTWYDDAGSHFLPEWAWMFVNRVDDSRRAVRVLETPNTTPITASQALAILDEVAPTNLASSKGGPGKPQSARLAGKTSGPAQ